MQDWRASGNTTVFVREIGEEVPAWETDKDFLDVYSKYQHLSLVSPYRLYTIFNFARLTSKLPGDFFQVGIYRGGSAKMISYWKNARQHFHLIDTFSGLPAPGPEDGRHHEGQFGDTSFDSVKQLFEDDESVSVYQGTFPSDPKGLLEDLKIAFCYLDVDLYDSCFDSLQAVFPHIVSGGVVVVDDFGLDRTGIDACVKRFVAEAGDAVTMLQFVRFQVVLMKS
jgi:O-methyltransferase